jgi:hypothetical protein
MADDEPLKLALEALDGGHVDRAYEYIQEALVKGEEHMKKMSLTQAYHLIAMYKIWPAAQLTTDQLTELVEAYKTIKQDRESKQTP